MKNKNLLENKHKIKYLLGINNKFKPIYKYWWGFQYLNREKRDTDLNTIQMRESLGMVSSYTLVEIQSWPGDKGWREEKIGWLRVFSLTKTTKLLTSNICW